MRLAMIDSKPALLIIDIQERLAASSVFPLANWARKSRRLAEAFHWLDERAGGLGGDLQ